MVLLTVYILIAVGFSFLCSIAEAVLLSVTTSYIASLEKEGKRSGKVLRKLKNDINSPLAVILTLNTIAHTIGAAGAGAQATAVFGSASLGIVSAILTLIILVFSEIIPKALGAHYWRQLAPMTGFVLTFLVKVLYPFVVLSNALTRGLSHGPTLTGFSRKEFAAMAELGEQEGQLEEQESRILSNIFHLRDTPVRAHMTPRTVVFSAQQDVSIEDMLNAPGDRPFSRVPIYDDPDDITGFVLRRDLLAAKADGRGNEPLKSLRRHLPAVLDKSTMLNAFEQFSSQRVHLMMVVDEYGTMMGVLSLEDIIETMLGLEIVDEGDTVRDMQALARRVAARRRRRLGLEEDMPEN